MRGDGSILIKIVGDDKELQDALHSSEESVKKSLKTVTSVITKVTAATAGALSALAGLGVTYNSQMEDYTASFKVMLGTAEAAASKVNELKEMAAATPFGMAELADATQTLLAFQVPAEESMDILQMLGDVSLGSKEKLSGLALVFGQVASAGRLQGQDLMQMINQGFNPLNYIAKRTGESMEELRDRMSKGAVSADEVTQAFKDATSEGGQFYKGMETASKTVSGLVSTLKDDAMSLIGEVVQPINDELRDNLLPTALDAVAEISEAFARGGLDDAVAAFGDVLADGVSLVADMAPDMLDAAMDLISAFAKGLWRNRGKIGKTLKKIVNELLDKLDDVAPVLKPVTSIVRKLTDNFEDLIPAVEGLLTAMAAYHTAMGFLGLLDKISAATSPTLQLVVAASALVGVIGTLVAAFNAEYHAVERATATERAAAEAAKERLQSYNDMVEAQHVAAAADLAQLDNVEGLCRELNTLADENGNVEEANRTRAQFILSELNKALGTEYEMTDGQIQKYQELTQTVYAAINAKRAEILLTSQEALYRDALEKRADAEKSAADALSRRNELLVTSREAEKDLIAAQTEFNRAMSEDHFYEYTAEDRSMLANKLDDAQKYYDIVNKKLEETTEEYNASQAHVDQYYKNISLYEQAYAAAAEGNTEEVIRLLQLGDTAYLESEKFKKQSLSKQKADYEEYLGSLEDKMKILEATVRNGGGKAAEAALEEAQKQHKEVLAEYNALIGDMENADASGAGVNLINTFIEGVDSRKAAARYAAWQVAQEAKKAMSATESINYNPYVIAGSHASGLDRVPYDGYIAELHKDEMVLPADLARRMRAAVDAEQTYTAAAASKTADVYALRRMLSPPPSTTTTNNYNHTSVFNSPKAMSWRDMRLYQESQRQQLELLGV